ncbi:MAG: hypothetical protein FD175_2529 [Beijerinckiaceae bacterium]|nr:MAG: hypothetical protein FD175_2529 [Beijerinckiaceae bacterium]
MNRFRMPAALRRASGQPAHGGARDVFQRFFDLIERFERPRRPPDKDHAPEVKARITRLDDEPKRKP